MIKIVNVEAQDNSRVREKITITRTNLRFNSSFIDKFDWKDEKLNIRFAVGDDKKSTIYLCIHPEGIPIKGSGRYGRSIQLPALVSALGLGWLKENEYVQYLVVRCPKVDAEIGGEGYKLVLNKKQQIKK